jgi:hypothetical protein
MKRDALTTLALATALYAQFALAGPLDPECTAEKAARSAATKATVGVGGRCDPKETAADTAKRTAGVEDKGPIEKRRDDDNKGVDAAKGAANRATR